MVKKVLFVCSGNLDRSPTAEGLLKGMEGFEVKSAGIMRSAPTVISRELVEWTDVIFAMQEEHKETVIRLNPNAEKKIVVLDIPDRYRKDNPELVGLLKQRISEYLPIAWKED